MAELGGAGRDRGPLAVAALAVALRLVAVCLLPPDDAYPDTVDYVGFGRVLADGSGWWNDSLRPPFYPMFLAAIFKLGGGLTAVKLAQVLLDGVTVVALVRLALALGLTRGFALGAGLLWAVNPFGIQFARLVLSECLGGTLLVGALALWARPGGAPRARALASGALLGLCALTRASTLVVIPLAALLRPAGGDSPPVARLARAALLCAGAALAILPWAVRNTVLYGEVVLIAPTGGRSLWDGLSEYADGGPRMKGPEVWPHADNAASTDRLYRALAVEWARAHPHEVVALAVEKQRRFWSPVPNFEKYRRMPYVLVGFFELPLILAGLGGCVLAVAKRLPAWRLVPVLACFPLLHLVYLGSVRYRMPIEPLLCIFAALAAQVAWTRRPETTA